MKKIFLPTIVTSIIISWIYSFFAFQSPGSKGWEFLEPFIYSFIIFPIVFFICFIFFFIFRKAINTDSKQESPQEVRVVNSKMIIFGLIVFALTIGFILYSRIYA